MAALGHFRFAGRRHRPGRRRQPGVGRDEDLCREGLGSRHRRQGQGLLGQDELNLADC